MSMCACVCVRLCVCVWGGDGVVGCVYVRVCLLHAYVHVSACMHACVCVCS